jgi:hypothetical protein
MSASLPKIIFEKNGIKIQKEKDDDEDKFTVTFFIENEQHNDITKFVSINFLKLVHDLNPDMFESIDIHTFSGEKEEANVFLVFKDLFGDLGLPQFYTCFRIMLSEEEDGVKTFALAPLEITAELLELKQKKVEIPLRKCTMVCDARSVDHIVFRMHTTFVSNEFFSTSYIEKMASMLVIKVLNRVKQFIYCMK